MLEINEIYMENAPKMIKYGRPVEDKQFILRCNEKIFILLK